MYTNMVLGEEESVLIREVSLFQGFHYIHSTCTLYIYTCMWVGVVCSCFSL